MVAKTGGDESKCRVIEWSDEGVIRPRTFCTVAGDDGPIRAFAGNAM